MGTDFTGTQKDKKTKEQTRREQLSKYLYDVSKVFIAGMFVVNIVSIFEGDATMSNIVSIVMGALASIALAWTANRILIY